MKMTSILTAFFSLSLMAACGTASSGNSGYAAGETANNSANVKPTPAGQAQKAATKKSDKIILSDGRDSLLAQKTFTEDDVFLVTTEFELRKEAIKEDFGDKYCEDDDKITIYGSADGSFTRPGSKQRVYLYAVCSMGSSHFGVGGIVIFENNKAVTHYVYGENGLDGGIETTADIDNDGMAEIVLSDLQVHQGYAGGAITVLNFIGGNLKIVGTASNFSSNSGAAENEKDIVAEAHDISVEPGKTPVFYRDVYVSKGSDENWTVSKKAEKFELMPLEAKFIKGYRRVGK